VEASQAPDPTHVGPQLGGGDPGPRDQVSRAWCETMAGAKGGPASGQVSRECGVIEASARLGTAVPTILGRCRASLACGPTTTRSRLHRRALSRARQHRARPPAPRRALCRPERWPCQPYSMVPGIRLPANSADGMPGVCARREELTTGRALTGNLYLPGSQAVGAAANLEQPPRPQAPLARGSGNNRRHRRPEFARCGGRCLAVAGVERCGRRAATAPSRTCGSEARNWKMSLCRASWGDSSNPAQRLPSAPATAPPPESRSRNLRQMLTLAVLLVEARVPAGSRGGTRTDAASTSRSGSATRFSKKDAAIQDPPPLARRISSPKEDRRAWKAASAQPAEPGALKR